MRRVEFIRMLTLTSLYCVLAPRVALARNYLDVTSWDPYVKDIGDVDTYLRRKFRQDVTDPTTGFSQEELGRRMKAIVAAGKASGESWRITKAKCFAEQALRMSIDISPFDWFPAISVWNRRTFPIRRIFADHAEEVNLRLIPGDVRKAWEDGNNAGDWVLWQDFDHSVPDWRVVLDLGFAGLAKRFERYAGRKNADGRYDDPFYEGLRIAMEAMLGCLDRFVAQGEKRLNSDSAVEGGRRRLEKEVDCLRRLRVSPPQTAYDVLMFIWLYFMWSEHLDGIQCRSLTEIDVFVTPYYDADLVSGRTTEAEFREQFKHFLWQWGSISNYWNQPIALGGTKKDGSSEFNHVSRIVLEVMDACALTTPKFLVKVAPNTPDWAMDKMMDMARRHRSIAFLGEKPLSAALKARFGASDEDCRNMPLLGCYGYSLHDGANGAYPGHVNFLKPIERMLAEAAASGKDPYPDFDAFKAEYVRRLADVTERCRRIACWMELALEEVNPADLMTLATEHALQTRRDGYANGCRRGNESTIQAVGPGTTVDAMLAVKEIVYERRELTLAGLGTVMAANWEGQESLRLRMLRSKRKWGNDDPEANAIGGEILRCFASRLNGYPNVRGGKFAASGHGARQFIELGEKMGATPDGRKAGEEMSKNLSPTMGADTEGATALVMTLAHSGVTSVDLCDYPLDLMLHPSTCEGQKGLETMKTLVRLFHKNGGGVVQFTVFSAEELRDAQAHPEKYENLQVRICGWNVRWNDLSREEQDAYILRSERIMR